MKTTIRCINCGQVMEQDSMGNYHCPLCGETVESLVYTGGATLATGTSKKDVVSCLFCGEKKEYAHNEVRPFIYICDDCKDAIAWAKENMRKKNNKKGKRK